MEQNTKQWHDWRATGLGSSDAPKLMGVSKYATPYQLWQEKTGKVPRDEETSFIQDKGNRAEIFARARLELEVGFDLPPAQGQHQEHTFLLGSADGWNPEKKVGAEFKLASKEDHDNVLKGIVPRKYFPQIQHLILVFGATEWLYGSYWCDKGMAVDKGDLRWCVVKPDIKWLLEEYLPQAIYMNDCIKNDKAPELTDDDAKFIKNKEHLELVKSLHEAKKKVETASAAYEEIEAKVVELCGESVKTIFGETGITFGRSWRKGTIQYKDIPELIGVDLEPYRGKSILVPKFNFPKEKK